MKTKQKKKTIILIRRLFRWRWLVRTGGVVVRFTLFAGRSFRGEYIRNPIRTFVIFYRSNIEQSES